MGATPQTLAWSIAAGIFVGINPVLGTTTILCLAVAFGFRLNVVATQIANHAMFPLELVLVVPFIRLGSRVFHTAPMPLSPSAFLAAVRTSPLLLARQLWLWEVHAVIVWGGDCGCGCAAAGARNDAAAAPAAGSGQPARISHRA